MIMKKNGITLIALIITIIVMLILVGVTVNIAFNNGLFGKTREARDGTQKAIEKEQLMSAVIGTADNRGDLQVNLAGSELSDWTLDSQTIPGEENSVWYKYTSPKNNVYYVNSKTGEIVEEEPTPHETLENDFTLTSSSQYNGYETADISITADISSLVSQHTFTDADEAARAFANVYKAAAPSFANVNTLADLNIEVYNMNNDPDINDQTSLRTALGLNSNATDEEVFAILSDGQSIYSIGQQAYVLSYEPTEYSVKITDGTQTKDITESISFDSLKFGVAKYRVDKNGTYEIEINIDGKKATSTIVVSELEKEIELSIEIVSMNILKDATIRITPLIDNPIQGQNKGLTVNGVNVMVYDTGNVTWDGNVALYHISNYDSIYNIDLRLDNYIGHGQIYAPIKKYVKFDDGYDSDGDGETDDELYILMYNPGEYSAGAQIVSESVLEENSITLGVNDNHINWADESVISEADLDNNNTLNYREKSIYSYNHAIETLNNICSNLIANKQFVAKDANNEYIIRSYGSNPSNRNAEGSLIVSGIYPPLKDTDTNYITDNERYYGFNSGIYLANFWIASRELFLELENYDGMNCWGVFGIRCWDGPIGRTDFHAGYSINDGYSGPNVSRGIVPIVTLDPTVTLSGSGIVNNDIYDPIIISK